MHDHYVSYNKIVMKESICFSENSPEKLCKGYWDHGSEILGEGDEFGFS